MQQRPGDLTQINDRLLVTPAQFRAEALGSGALRRFTTLVLEVTYVRADAPQLLVEDTIPPVLNVRSGLMMPVQSASMAQNLAQVWIDGSVADEAGGSGSVQVTALYAVAGQAWQTANLTISNGRISGVLSLPGSGVATIRIEARDAAGNTTATTLIQQFFGGMPGNNLVVYLPAITRP